MDLSDLTRSEGWTLVVDDGAGSRADLLGSPQTDELSAQACAGNVVAIPSGFAPIDAFFAVAHEIAEARYDFTGHHQHVWREQCNILARWCRKLTGALTTEHAQSSRELDAVRESLDQCRKERGKALDELVRRWAIPSPSAISVEKRAVKDTTVVWRGSVTDLLTDLAPLLGTEGLNDLENQLWHKRVRDSKE